jgi:hypothetical protein
LHGNESKDFECWNELTAKMKECLLSSFNMQITQADEDTRRLDQQRLMPGWNYCQFFIMKESLAFTYELMSLCEEALLHYDELEAGFFQTLSEQALPWFKKFGGTEPLDDSADVLDFNRKSYREAIYQNSTTIFDFRIYLFSKQCHLLRKLGHPLQFMTRAHSFIASFSQTLSEYRVSLIPFFKESWIYSACISIVQAGDELMARNEQSLVVTKQYESLKANLLHLARIQLDKLGRIYEKLNRPVHPWATELNQEDWTQIASAADGNGPKNTIFPTHPDLQEALSSVEAFDKLYIVIIYITYLSMHTLLTCHTFRTSRLRR